LRNENTPAKKIRIEDIAREAGVGLGTVSRALNNRPGVSRKRRELVTRIMAEHGYRPNVLARGLAAGQTRNIEVVFNTSAPKISQDPIVLRFLDGVLPEMTKRRYMMFFSALHSEFSRQDVHADVFGKQGHIDGLILVTNRMQPGFLSALKKAVSVPLVLVGYCADSRDVGCVANDSFGGSYKAVQYLHGLGRRRIGFVGANGMLQPVRLRFDGYRAALADLGLAVRNEFVALADTPLFDRHSIEAMLSGTSRPDALLAATEDFVPEVLGIAARLGLRVPDQLNVASFWDTTETPVTGGFLPNVIVQWEQIGREAVTMLTGAIEQGRELGQVLIAPELTWAQSSIKKEKHS